MLKEVVIKVLPHARFRGDWLVECLELLPTEQKIFLDKLGLAEVYTTALDTQLIELSTVSHPGRVNGFPKRLFPAAYETRNTFL